MIKKNSKKEKMQKERTKDKKKTLVKMENKKETNPLKVKEKENSFSVHKTKIKVIGIGGGAESILSEIYQNFKNIDFVCIDTVSKKKNVSKLKKIYLGENITHGFGTGMNPELGEISAESEKKKIEGILKNQDICIFVSCLGGGFGSGAMPVLAKIAKNMNIITYGIFTLPFFFEGEKKKNFADLSIEKSKPFLNAYSVIPNEIIFKAIDKETPIKQAFSTINKKIAENLKGLIETLYSPGLINIDFADFKTILSGRGNLAFLNTTYVNKEKIEDDLIKIISNDFFEYDAKGAKGIIYNILGGEDLEIREVSLISKTISNYVNKKSKIIFGINQSRKYQKKIKIVLFAIDCNSKDNLESIESEEKKGKDKKKKKIKVSEKNKKEYRKSGIEIRAEEVEKEKEFLEEDVYETPAIFRNII